MDTLIPQIVQKTMNRDAQLPAWSPDAGIQYKLNEIKNANTLTIVFFILNLSRMTSIETKLQITATKPAPDIKDNE